jgi:hypothetical protein
MMTDEISIGWLSRKWARLLTESSAKIHEHKAFGKLCQVAGSERVLSDKSFSS